MAKYTLFYRNIDTGVTDFTHVEGLDLSTVSETFDDQNPHAYLIGAMAGHVEVLWWELGVSSDEV